MLVLELLRYAAWDSPSNSASRVVSPPSETNDGEIQWVLDAGLGPLLHRATRGRPGWSLAPWREVLLRADLTARVLHGTLVSTACELIDICRDQGLPVTLLKGIWISDQCYPAPHLRPMADIDILVSEDHQEWIESELLRRGYLPMRDHGLDENTRHGVPLRHPQYPVWFEIHTALFEGVAPGAVFSSAHIADQSVAAPFHGRPIRRLCDESQLLYIASSWVADLSRHGVKIHPSCLPALFDAVFLLKARAEPLDQEAIFGWPDSDMAIASLYVMLAFLSRCGFDLCDPVLLSRLGSSQRLVGPVQLRIIHTVLDRYLLGARPWNLPLPLPVPGRYSVRHQLRKRWLARGLAPRVPPG